MPVIPSHTLTCTYTRGVNYHSLSTQSHDGEGLIENIAVIME